MSGPARKTLFLRDVPTDLVREAKAVAARRGETLTTIVAEALTRSLGVDGMGGETRLSDDLHADMEWYRNHRTGLIRRYRGEYVAIVEGKVVDHGHDFGAVAGRVFARFGDRSVYMPRVQPNAPEARIRSPRRSRP